MANVKKYSVLLIMAVVVMGVSAAALAADKVNINTAGVEELAKLQRVGPKVAADIVEYRQKNGHFKTIEDLKRVKGVGDKVFELNKDAITVGDQKAVKPSDK